MKIIEYTHPINMINSTSITYYNHFYPNANLLFFDIETTGFVTKHTTLYLIGALWIDDTQIKIIQWFNEDGKSEKELIEAFTAFCKKFSHLIHFNGLGFDLPYLKEKAISYQIPIKTIEDLAQIDIYKKVKKYKNIFLTENMKQVTLEHFLNIRREDLYSGKELIQVYQKYLGHCNYDEENLLLLHNHDDLIGMIKFSIILNYPMFFEDTVIESIHTKIENHKLILSFLLPDYIHLPKRISLTKNEIYLNAIENEGSISIPIQTGELKHYFKDYKNYYYLPLEKIIIHKSIATYVDTKNKEKVSKENCYVSKKGDYIPYFHLETFDTFQLSFTDKERYLDLNQFLSIDSTLKTTYIKNILHTFLK